MSGFTAKLYSVAAGLLKAVLAVAYVPLKCFPSQNKVLFLSRQSNEPPLDFVLLKEELLRQDPSLKIVMITKRIEGGLPGAVTFGMCSLRSMYHLATAKVCVLDTYWPVVSLLHHKKSLTVIQMWHAIGKMKKSGYQTLDKRYGRSGSVAQAMNMHRGYDVVIAGGSRMNDYYCASFGVKEEQLLNIGLPRIDFLLATEQANRALLLEKYPQFAGKTVILYAPTFRRNTEADYGEMTGLFDPEKYALIIKPHPNQVLKQPNDLKKYSCGELTTMQALGACDILITDFSAITFEAAVMNKRIYFYLFDRQGYMRHNGVNIDPCVEMAGNVYEEPQNLKEAIEKGSYDRQALAQFRERYLPQHLGQSTKRMTKLIRDCVEEGKDEGIRKNLHRETETGLSVGHEDPVCG